MDGRGRKARQDQTENWQLLFRAIFHQLRRSQPARHLNGERTQVKDIGPRTRITTFHALARKNERGPTNFSLVREGGREREAGNYNVIAQLASCMLVRRPRLLDATSAFSPVVS